MADNIGGEQGLNAIAIGEGEVGGGGMEPDAEGCGLHRGIVLGQEGEDEAGKDVA